ncbi:MAG: DNA-binding protein WhiA [Clostridiales bacterium]|nr:MAG: DNA-binding protein WhiA [Clostridiales bacterium]
MSFSSKTKKELTRVEQMDHDSMMAELSAIVHISGTIKLAGKNRVNIEVNIKNAAIARHIFSLFKEACGIHTDIRMNKNAKLKKANIYTIAIEKEEGANEVLEALGIIRNTAEGFSINNSVPDELIEKEICKRAYLRGAFIGGGSLSDPERSYHLELVAHSPEYGEALMNIMRPYELSPKMIERKGSQVVYLKEGDQIIDFLNVIGAHQTLLDFENVRIMKQMRNDINRIVNCETANLTKTADAAYRQIQDILLIEEERGLDFLSENLKEIALARIEHREASLQELGQLLDSPIGKSGVNHRFKKIREIALEITEKKDKSK